MVFSETHRVLTNIQIVRTPNAIAAASLTQRY
jgi:hypothetical protein